VSEISFKANHATGEIAGYASVFDVIDAQGDAVQRGAFQNSITSYEGKGYMPPLLWQHKQDEPIGAIAALREDERGLWMEAKLAMSTTRGREAFELLSMGSIGSFSIGYRVPEGGAKSRDGVRELHLIDLAEVSVVTTPANEHARMRQLKHIEKKSDLEQLLRDAGLARAAARAVCSHGYAGLNPHSDESLEELADSLNKLTQSLKGN